VVFDSTSGGKIATLPLMTRSFSLGQHMGFVCFHATSCFKRLTNSKFLYFDDMLNAAKKSKSKFIFCS
jgi:hypothetical protein